MWKFALLAASLAAIASGCTTSSMTRAAPRSTLASPAPVTSSGVSITLTNGQIDSVRAYFSTMPSGTATGRGRGRNGRLPPGIARNLTRGKSLPPGIAKNYLPSVVAADLPRLPSGLDYVIVAGKLLLVEAATQVIREVLLDLAFDG